jgi:hypothetical protein
MATGVPLYLFCTWTPAFYPFWRIMRFEFSKSLGNSTILADRLPPPPPNKSKCFNQLRTLVFSPYLICT